MNVRYRVELSQAEREKLKALLNGGKTAVRKIKRAQILLAADTGVRDEEIAAHVGVGDSTVYRTKRRFVLGNVEAALSKAPRPGAERKLSGKEEALLVATACTKPPSGRSRWTLALLAGKIVELTEHASLSRETVRRRLAENELKPWRQKMWCIPEVDGTYVVRLEDVLDLYAEDPDPRRPVVCFDESPTQLIDEVRQPFPRRPAYPRHNYRVNEEMFLVLEDRGNYGRSVRRGPSARVPTQLRQDSERDLSNPGRRNCQMESPLADASQRATTGATPCLSGNEIRNLAGPFVSKREIGDF